MRQTLPIVILGTSTWFVALVFELAVGAKLPTIWICLVGISLGLLGIGYIVRGMRRSNHKS